MLRRSLALVVLVAALLIAGLPMVSFPPTHPHIAPSIVADGRGVASLAVPSPTSAAGRSYGPLLAAPSWTNLTGQERGHLPPAVAGGALAYDAADSEWVYFGGCTASRCPTNTTWVYANGGWGNVTVPKDAPPARAASSMAYDPHAGGVLLFGGEGPVLSTFSDTWLFHGGVWTNLSYYGSAPPPREGANLVYDPAPETNGTLLFGGCELSPGFVCLNDTWVWRPGAGWTVLLPGGAPPGARGHAMMAYDAADGYAVLYGGRGALCGASCYYQDTWEFYSGAWWHVQPSGGSPPQREAAAITFDSSTGSVLMFGGTNDSTSAAYNDSWTFSAGVWSPLSTLRAPTSSEGSALSVDSPGVPPLLVGGFSPPSFVARAETWTFEVPPVAAFERAPTSTEVSQPVSFAVSVNHGIGPYNVDLAFGDGNGTSAAGTGSGYLFGHSYLLPGTVTARAHASDFVGLQSIAFAVVSISLGPSASVESSSTSGDVGLPVTFTSEVHSSSGPITTYLWSFGDGATAGTRNATHTFGAPGSYAIVLDITDSAMAVAHASLAFAVLQPPTATISASSTPGVAGGVSTFVANTTGGTMPYRFSWLFGDGGSASSPGPSHSFAKAGQYEVQVWANDSSGGSSHATLSYSVSAAGTGGAPGPAGSSQPGPPPWYWGAVGVIALVTVISGALLLRRGPRSG